MRDFKHTDMRKISHKKRGVALFVSVLLSMSLAAISISAMLRISSVSQSTGAGLQDKKLLMYAESVISIASAEVQKMATEDEVIGYNTVYHISGGTDHSFRYYPRDVSIVPSSFYDRTLFAYRAVARRFAGAGSFPPGFSTPILDTEGQCFDITVDVREVIYIDDPNTNVDAPDTLIVGTDGRYYLGRSKTVGAVSCFITGAYGGAGGG